jgi:[ribosomal protein S18]-alanine N-acetyltransferase
VPLTAESFRIRDFHADDFDAIWQIDQACFPPGISYSRPELRAYVRRKNAFTLIAVGAEISRKEGGAIAGFIVGECNRGAGHIITIDVLADARRHGVGSMLLRAAEERLRTAGCGSVELETAVDNISAISFYKRHGFSIVKIAPRYYSNGVDALVLQKKL